MSHNQYLRTGDRARTPARTRSRSFGVCIQTAASWSASVTVPSREYRFFVFAPMRYDTMHARKHGFTHALNALAARGVYVEFPGSRSPSGGWCCHAQFGAFRASSPRRCSQYPRPVRGSGRASKALLYGGALWTPGEEDGTPHPRLVE